VTQRATYKLKGYDYPVEIRTHLYGNRANANFGTVRNFRIGLQVAEAQFPTRPLPNQPWFPDSRDAPFLERVDQRLVNDFGLPLQEFPARAWPGEYVDPLGWVYLDRIAELIGRRSDAGHVIPVP